MMTREEIKEVEQHCAEHGMTFKQRLNELNIPESNFYYARRMYSREDMVPSAGEEGKCNLSLEWRDIESMIRRITDSPEYRLRCLRGGKRY